MNRAIFIVFLSSVSWGQEDKRGGDMIVADAIFGDVSPYTGIVRFIQNVSDLDDGDFTTKVIVNLKRRDGQETTQHMWHVERNPVTVASVCDDDNPHFNPYGFEKSSGNYTTFCSGDTPDFCYMGDLSAKSALVSVGGVPTLYVANLVPLVGSNSIIGHSLNIHAENKIATRVACADIKLNTRLTTWTKIIKIPIKTPGKFPFSLVETRSAIADKLGLPTKSVQVAGRLDMLPLNSCQSIDFIITNVIPPKNWKFIASLKQGKVPLGAMSPEGCSIDIGGSARSSANQHGHAAIVAALLISFWLIWLA